MVLTEKYAKNTKEGIKEQLDQYLAEGVDHMLALRGDIPLGETTTCGDFNYATDLVKFVRDEFGDKFEIAVAGSPEGHIACRSLESDIAVLRQKQDNGADYIMTQLCWDMEQFKYWLDSIREAGVTMPVDVGVMPILDMSATINMALSRNGCVMDRELCRLISRNWLFRIHLQQKMLMASRLICSMMIRSRDSKKRESSTRSDRSTSTALSA